MGCVKHNGRARRVVVTGISAISPAGCTPEEYWRGITCGRSAVRRVTLFDSSELDIHTAGEVDLAPLAGEVPRASVQRPDRSITLGLLAGKRALEDAGLPTGGRNGERIGVFVGSGFGPCNAIALNYEIYNTKGARSIRPTTIPRCMFNSIASELSIAFDLTGGHGVMAAACASASLAMGASYDAVVLGREDVVLTGGCDSPLTRSIYVSWVNLRVLSSEADPARAMRPFDKTRDGFVLAEGASMLVFEELEHARARGARIYAEIIGHGTGSDGTRRAWFRKRLTTSMPTARRRC